MKRIISTISANEEKRKEVEGVPSIANKVVTMDTVLSWIDELVEVSENDSSNDNK